MSAEAEIRSIRLAKLDEMRALGHDPFQVEQFPRPESAKQILENFVEGRAVTFAGRMMTHREMGKAVFFDLSDGDERIQVYLRRDEVSETEWQLHKLADVGDHIGVEGKLFVTKTGQKSIHATRYVPLSKALEPLPVGKLKDGHVFSGLTDVETRYRHRHLDLVCNPDARRVLIERARITSAVRRYFDGEGYLEVETPLLQLEAGGASAHPFVTHYRAYDMDVKLRISLELYLKRLICGDIPAVYEIGRVFRNERVSNRHNPEFTLLEFYEAYVNLERMMERVEDCFRFVAESVYGKTIVDSPDGPLDFGQPWRRIDLLGSIEAESGVPADSFQSIESALTACHAAEVERKARERNAEIKLADETDLGGLIEKLLEVFVEPMLIQPTFVIGYPIETSPLAKKDPRNARLTRRFEGYVRGREVCNAFSEINDPIDQRERFEAQLARREDGDDEAHPMDEEFLYALECGMPPTGGCGIGIDRMAMLLSGADHIREVLFFPFMRPVHAESPDGA